MLQLLGFATKIRARFFSAAFVPVFFFKFAVCVVPIVLSKSILFSFSSLESVVGPHGVAGCSTRMCVRVCFSSFLFSLFLILSPCLFWLFAAVVNCA